MYKKTFKDIRLVSKQKHNALIRSQYACCCKLACYTHIVQRHCHDLQLLLIFCFDEYGEQKVLIHAGKPHKVLKASQLCTMAIPTASYTYFLTKDFKACKVKILICAPHVRMYSKRFWLLEGIWCIVLRSVLMGPKIQVLCLPSLKERDTPGSFAR